MKFQGQFITLQFPSTVPMSQVFGVSPERAAELCNEIFEYATTCHKSAPDGIGVLVCSGQFMQECPVDAQTHGEIAFCAFMQTQVYLQMAYKGGKHFFQEAEANESKANEAETLLRTAVTD